MVSYRGQDGKQSYHQADELSDAIQFVEHLRNDEAVDHARIFKMEELNFEFRPYYRVELATSAGPAATATADVPPPPPVDADAPEWHGATDEAPSRPTDDDVDPLAAVWSASPDRDDQNGDHSVGAGMGRRGLFGR
jgi:hypothetical protein